MSAKLMAPFSATTVRFIGGRSVIHDGPFTPEANAIGSFCIIEAANLDDALAIARTWALGGYVEIRPLARPAGMDEFAILMRWRTEARANEVRDGNRPLGGLGASDGS